MKLKLPPKLVEKLVRVSIILFCKIFILSYAFDALFLYERSKAIHEKTHVFCLFMFFFENILK
jgi:hypothetical protein